MPTKGVGPWVSRATNECCEISRSKLRRRPTGVSLRSFKVEIPNPKCQIRNPNYNPGISNSLLEFQISNFEFQTERTCNDLGVDRLHVLGHSSAVRDMADTGRHPSRAHLHGRSALVRGRLARQALDSKLAALGLCRFRSSHHDLLVLQPVDGTWRGNGREPLKNLGLLCAHRDG